MSRFFTRGRCLPVLSCMAVGVAACGVSSSTAVTRIAPPGAPITSTAKSLPHTAAPAADWPTFDANAQRSGVGPSTTGITATGLRHLRRITVHLDGTVDASVIEASNVRIDGRDRDVVILTTSYGHTEALDAASGHKLWEFTPSSTASLQGGTQITTTTPVLDPDRRYVYAASPDGLIHKLVLATGHQDWQTPVTRDARHEKLAGALNFDGSELVTETDGYVGDVPPYVGHVVTIDPATGRITHVFNSLCSNIRGLMSSPAICSKSDSAIWGRPGAVVEPDGNILVATSNGDFNGHTDWGDSVLELSASLRLLHNWTPADQQQLNVNDKDLGSTEPALLPVRNGRRFAIQGGKDGILRLLNLAKLDGTTGPAGPRTGGELQRINAPGPTDVFSQPAVWHSLVFVADGSGSAAYRYGANNRLHETWHNTTPGTSPIVAGGLLFIYDQTDGRLDVYDPTSGHLDSRLTASPGHWNSPTVVGGRILLPTGNDNAHQTNGTLYIWH